MKSALLKTIYILIILYAALSGSTVVVEEENLRKSPNGPIVGKLFKNADIFTDRSGPRQRNWYIVDMSFWVPSYTVKNSESFELYRDSISIYDKCEGSIIGYLKEEISPSLYHKRDGWLNYTAYAYIWGPSIGIEYQPKIKREPKTRLQKDYPNAADIGMYVSASEVFDLYAQGGSSSKDGRSDIGGGLFGDAVFLKQENGFKVIIEVKNESSYTYDIALIGLSVLYKSGGEEGAQGKVYNLAPGGIERLSTFFDNQSIDEVQGYKLMLLDGI
jgi:hypothetical protein